VQKAFGACQERLDQEAIHLAQHGVSLGVVRDFLGHVDIKTTDVYAGVNLETKRAAIENVNPAPIRTLLRSRTINRESPHTVKMLCKAIRE
jgi:hypothetical protein